MGPSKGKLSKQEVHFEHPAKGMHKCYECVHFLLKKEECKIVAGKVEKNDWCDKWLKD
jgi:hypothetical protein